MGFIPADKEFLHELRKICDENGTLLIFDEVMSGFRATVNGAESLTGVVPDLVTLGKVIGGGMPVGAFGARREIMAKLSPEGPVYQAGTLSGNPVAMAAGFVALTKLKKNAQVMSVLNERAKRLVDGMKEVAKENGINMQTDTRGSMFGFFLHETPVKNFADACSCDSELFAKFHSGMLAEGFYFACSLYETGFISTAITDEMIEDTIKASAKVFKAIANG
jgi:glutamate-1-semialdehyde 2,1-aminomutase